MWDSLVPYALSFVVFTSRHCILVVPGAHSGELELRGSGCRLHVELKRCTGHGTISTDGEPPCPPALTTIARSLVANNSMDGVRLRCGASDQQERSGVAQIPQLELERAEPHLNATEGLSLATDLGLFPTGRLQQQQQHLVEGSAGAEGGFVQA